MEVLINGIRYVPAAEIPPASDEKIHEILRELVSMHYFNETHKMRGQLYNAIRVISPELADLVNDDPDAAYDLMNPEK